MINNLNTKEMETLKAIAITLGTDDNGNHVSISVWAADSINIYTSYDLQAEESKKWLSCINIEEGKKYYSLIQKATK